MTGEEWEKKKGKQGEKEQKKNENMRLGMLAEPRTIA